MNWSKIAVLAALLFVAQFLVGFFGGFLQQSGSVAFWFLAGPAASFLLCSTIFAFSAIRNLVKPFAHAWLGLLLHVLAALAFSALLPASLGSTPWSSVALEWIVLIASLVVGTSVGIKFRTRIGKRSDA